MEHFVENLRTACATKRSISQICREIGINRQQFNRYINGETMPSAHNLARIADHFGLMSGDFSLPPRIFVGRLQQPKRGGAEGSELFKGFPGDIASLRRHVGYFQTYHQSPSWPGMVVCSVSRIFEREGLMHVRSAERVRDVENEIHQYTKYDGLAAFLRNRIFIYERARGPSSILSQTILLPFEVHQKTYLRGTTMGVSWRKESLPYASRMIWRYLGTAPDLRQMLSRSGVVPLSSRQLPPTVKSFLDAPEADVLSVPIEY
ncbi:helix-turn-helix transcriptional regulator [Rhizobium sp. L1K21]|uniref:helix-turn-helix domain-containing protein n=1 Tax=Rhizobium sp. L1K21 TaxID=2954933 RepID=UPI0020935FEA|nr:helix-turn-helix transcriptional regulator [Rhizobium sp. L1K21]MCO6184692.1 helix-turn-helix domain-containing protein [Rhizobium sp. L1K21]